VPDRGEFGLLDARLVGSRETVRPGRFAVALASVPPLDEVSALGMGLVFALHAHMVAAQPALAVKEGLGK